MYDGRRLPSAEYLEIILRGAERQGLPDAYRRCLASGYGLNE